MPKRLNPYEIPLKTVVCDPHELTASVLISALKENPAIVSVERVTTLDDCRRVLRESDSNTILIDPLGFDLEAAAELIFAIRNALPEIVFVLYIDKAVAERNRQVFYRGERSRFSHYYTLDKRTPIGTFREELFAVLRTCQVDLSWRMQQASIQRLREEASKPRDSRGPNVELLEQVRILVEGVQPLQQDSASQQSGTVFLSYRFAETEYLNGLSKLLKQEGFKVTTGMAANTYISKAVLDRIRSSQFFLSLMTKADEKVDGTYTTSPWLLEEKGAALAYGKPLVLMIEEGVSDVGGLQGDWQRIHFGAKGFLTAALEAVEQLKSYVGNS